MINGKTTIDPNELIAASMIEMTLAPGSGLFADVADFIGNYRVTATYMSKDVELFTTSDVAPHLPALSKAVNTLKPADGGENASALPLTATYGYAIDLAFRCNAVDPDLVLQTKGVQRVYSGSEDGQGTVSESGSTQGGGSYMEFSSKDDNFTLEQRLALMDAIRVGFVDDQGNILGIAKLNVTSREVVEEGVIKAPLYLYDYTFEKDDLTGGMILTMGERKLTDNLITDFINDGNKYPAVGVSFGLDVIYTLIKDREEFSNSSLIDLYIIPLDTEIEALKIANKLRSMGYNIEIDETDNSTEYQVILKVQK